MSPAGSVLRQPSAWVVGRVSGPVGALTGHDALASWGPMCRILYRLLIPPIVRVRLPVRDPERARSQFISAVMQAASVDWYRPTEASGVREPLESLWPQLRERGPRTEGLAEHLETVIETPGESSVEWFYHAAEAAMEAAFLAGAPVLVTASGSWASMAPDIPSGCPPPGRSHWPLTHDPGTHPRRNRLQRCRGLVAGLRDRTRHSRLRAQGQLSERSDARVGRARAGHTRRRAGVAPASAQGAGPTWPWASQPT